MYKNNPTSEATIKETATSIVQNKKIIDNIQTILRGDKKCK